MRTKPMRVLTGEMVAQLMAPLFGGAGLPIQLDIGAACLNVRLAGHDGEPTPDRSLELGFIFEIPYDRRAPPVEADRIIAARLARHAVGVCHGDVDDEDLIADACVALFAVRLPLRVPADGLAESAIQPKLSGSTPRTMTVRRLTVQCVLVRELREHVVPSTEARPFTCFISHNFDVDHRDWVQFRNWIVHFVR